MENSTAYASPEIVAETTLNFLAQKNSTDIARPRLTATPVVFSRPWSTLYFLAIQVADESRKLVVKIVRFDDQKTADLSWRSENLLQRGRCEFETMRSVFNHFANQPNASLQALHPLVYIPEINATVMDFSEGARMNDYITTQHLFSAKGRQHTTQMMKQAGQWLRWLHTMPKTNYTDQNLFDTTGILQELLNRVSDLHQLGVTVAQDVDKKIIAILKHIPQDTHVWNHGDFITGNFLVLPNKGVLGLDVVLDRIDSPYYDLGRFVGDLKTRRSSILRWGRLPSPRAINSLREAFLNGYFNGEQYNKLLLALYEGYFIFREWVDMLTYIQDKYSGRKTFLGNIIIHGIINPTFHRIVKQWTSTIRDAANA